MYSEKSKDGRNIALVMVKKDKDRRANEASRRSAASSAGQGPPYNGPRGGYPMPPAPSHYGGPASSYGRQSNYGGQAPAAAPSAGQVARYQQPASPYPQPARTYGQQPAATGGYPNVAWAPNPHRQRDPNQGLRPRAPSAAPSSWAPSVPPSPRVVDVTHRPPPSLSSSAARAPPSLSSSAARAAYPHYPRPSSAAPAPGHPGRHGRRRH
ncbi:hypothetical protein F4819DRAFT_485612 [Hypoxylon fuscum]|nr:hypothetical protein F4819DRAFT_485612 [Hypoxylon fuscum]